jgi:hypothetical protein
MLLVVLVSIDKCFFFNTRIIYPFCCSVSFVYWIFLFYFYITRDLYLLLLYYLNKIERYQDLYFFLQSNLPIFYVERRNHLVDSVSFCFHFFSNLHDQKQKI